MGGTNQGGGLSMMYAATLSGGFGVLGFGGANGFGSSTSMYGGRALRFHHVGRRQHRDERRHEQRGGARSRSGSASYSGGGGGGANAGGGRNRARTGTNNARPRTRKTSGSNREWKSASRFRSTKNSAVAKTVRRLDGCGQARHPLRRREVSMAGSVAILRGTVPSLNDRQLAEQIAMLDPSVTSVRNELTVTPAPKKKVASQQ